MTFTLVISPGTATNGSDYTLASTTYNLTIPAGGTNAGISFPVVNDLTPEPTETFSATITSASVVLTDWQATCTIIDQDTDPQITSDDPVATEGDPGDPAHYVTFTLSLSKASQKQVTVQVDTSDLTALKVVDYEQLQNVIVTFAPGVTSRQVQVKIVDDLKIEPEEKFKLNLSNPTNAGLAIDFAFGTIKDNDVGIDADINRNGTVEDTADEAHEEDVGTIVIADKEDVYTDPNEPARRREIVLRNGDNALVRVNRSGDKLKLYSAATGGNELFGMNNEITLAPGQSYWLQGGANPSASVQGDYLRVRKDDNNAPYKDRVNVTVLWVELDGRSNGTLHTSPIYDGRANIETQLTGHANLGVQRSLAASNDTDKTVHGFIELFGNVLPADVKKDSFGTDLTSGFLDPSVPVFGNPFEPDIPGSPADAGFGFVFHRTIDSKRYINGIGTPWSSKFGVDDSFRSFQDVDPNASDNKSAIIDVDGPSVFVSEVTSYMSSRQNFEQHVSFSFLPNLGERASKNYKWALTTDIARNYNDQAVFVGDAPNNNAGTNEVKLNGNLTSLELGVVAATIDSASTSAGNKLIQRLQDVEVTIFGANLIGQVYLKSGDLEIKARSVKVKETNSMFSNLTEIRAVFRTSAPAEAGYELVIRNAGGDKALAGFEIVD